MNLDLNFNLSPTVLCLGKKTGEPVHILYIYAIGSPVWALG